MTTKPIVESFALDHDAVTAPYVRAAARYALSAEDTPVTKYDIRFSQPNKEFLSAGAMHTLEHLLAVNLRTSHIGPAVIDISPMGCRTGFYLILRGDYGTQAVGDAIAGCLERVAEVESEEDIPGRARTQCGNWLEHDLTGAREWAMRWLDGVASKGYEPFV